MEPRLNQHDSGPGTDGVRPPGFAFSKDRGTMMRRKSFMESLLQLKHHDLATGYLSKLTTKGRWQERWFVVHGHYLSYFRKHLETSQHVGLVPSPAGSINLWHVTQVTLDHNKIILELDRDALASRAPGVSADSTAPEASYVLKADCDETARSWVNAMRDAPITEAQSSGGWFSGDKTDDDDVDIEEDDMSSDSDEIPGEAFEEIGVAVPADACAIEVGMNSFTVATPTTQALASASLTPVPMSPVSKGRSKIRTRQSASSKQQRQGSEALVVHSLGIAPDSADETELLVPDLHELLDGRPTRLLLNGVSAQSKVRLCLALRDEPKRVVGHSDFSFPSTSAADAAFSSVNGARRASVPGGGQLTLHIHPHADAECHLPLSEYVLLLDWSFVDWPAFRDLSALATSSSAAAGMRRFSTESSHNNAAAAAAASAAAGDDAFPTELPSSSSSLKQAGGGGEGDDPWSGVAQRSIADLIACNPKQPSRSNGWFGRGPAIDRLWAFGKLGLHMCVLVVVFVGTLWLVSHRTLMGAWMPASALVNFDHAKCNYAMPYSLHDNYANTDETSSSSHMLMLGLMPSVLLGLIVTWVCWFAGLVTPSVLLSHRDVLRGGSTDGSWLWWLPGRGRGSFGKDDTEGRFMIRRVLIVDRHGRRGSGTAARGYGGGVGDAGRQHRGQSVIDGLDESLTEFEKDLLGELRIRLGDLKGPPGSPVFSKGSGNTVGSFPSTRISHGMSIGMRGRRAKRGFSKPLYEPQRFGPMQQDETSVAQRHMDMYNRYVACDFRLVRFLRARRMNVNKAERMVRRCVWWRVNFGADTIGERFTPKRWLMDYCFPKELMELVDGDMDRRSWYLNDRNGHLCMFLRSGPMNWKGVFEKIGKDDDMLMALGVWVLELVRYDLDKLHKDTNGNVPSYLTLIFDLQGFSVKQQIPPQHAVKIARKFFDIVATAYPELLNRVLIVNAPWLFFSVWHLFAPLLPREMVDKISIHGHGKSLAHILKVCDPDKIPMYLGGTLAIDGDPYCINKLPPAGPWMPDQGEHCLLIDDEEVQE